MAKVIRKKAKAEFSIIKPTEIEQIIPERKVAVKLSTEDTSWMVIYKDEVSAVLLAMDGTYETISIPINQFNRGVYSFSVDNEKIKSKLTMYEGVN